MAAPAAGTTDEDLLVAIRGGDGGALGQLYDRYGRLAFGVAYRVLEERGAAEDAVQDAFLAVWQRAATYHPERGTVRAWLLTITRNAAVDRRRGRHAWALSWRRRRWSSRNGSGVPWKRCRPSSAASSSWPTTAV
jgi:DNA-directed RNA polymerase specialized sigma24 family protein